MPGKFAENPRVRVKSSQVKWGRHERNEGTTGRARPARALKEIRAQRQVSEVKRFQTVVISFTVSRGLAPRLFPYGSSRLGVFLAVGIPHNTMYKMPNDLFSDGAGLSGSLPDLQGGPLSPVAPSG